MKKKRDNLKFKRTQTNVIVVVLLILVALVAAGFLGTFIYKFVKENAQFDNVQIELYIDTTRGLPCFDSDAGKAMFYIKRGAGNANLSGIKLIAYYENQDSVSIVNEIGMQELENIAYSISALETKPDEIRIAPIVKIGTKEKTLAVSSSAKVVASDNCAATINTANTDFGANYNGAGASNSNFPAPDQENLKAWGLN